MDPYMQYELEVEWNSQFDYISEAYGATARDCLEMARQDSEYYAELEREFIGPHKPVDFSDEIPF